MREIQSPLLRELRTKLSAGDGGALEEFWSFVEQQGTPLIEEIAGDDKNLYVTFLWRAAEENRDICLLGTYFGFDCSHKLVQLPGTDIWYKTYLMPNTMWSLYMFSLVDRDDENNYEDHFDPLNPITYTCPQDKENPICRMLIEVESVLVLPGVLDRPWETMQTIHPRGGLQEFRISSTILENERRVWVYTPHGYDPNNEYTLALCTDGWEYLNMTQATSILDELIGSGDIPPLVAVFVDIISFEHRAVELYGNRLFAEFLCAELLPWLDENYSVTQVPHKRVIVGASAGGFNAAYIGLNHSEVFGNVLAQSGAFQWKPEGVAEEHYLASMYQSNSKKPLRFYLEVGQLEPNFIIDEVKHMVNVLKNLGYEVHFHLNPSGHNFLAWNPGLKIGLKTLLAKRESP